jgi:ABC-2 type transport system permease protein/lipopolysaccharide transport system permease protein
MTDDDRVLTRGERLRTLISDDKSGPREPRPEWMYHRPLRPARLLREVWRARSIVRTLTERDLRVRYKQSLLGFTWAVLTPLGLLVAFMIVFQRAAGVETGGPPYPLFAFIGLVPWMFFSSAVSTGGNSVLNDKALLSKAQFPREVFPLSGVAVAGVDALMGLVPLMVLFLAYGRAPSVTTPLAVLPLIVMIAFVTGLALLLSAVIVHLRDVRLALPLALQILLFATPVGYSLDVVPAGFRLAYSFINPLGPVIDSYRRTVLMGEQPQWDHLGAASVTAAVCLVAGYLVFKRLETGFADVA